METKEKKEIGKPQGFIGTLERQTTGASVMRIMRVTHSVFNGKATMIREGEFQQWILDKCENTVDIQRQRYTIGANHFRCIGDNGTKNNQFYIDYDKAISVSKRGNLCFEINETDFGLFYLDKDTFDHQFQALMADVEDEMLKHEIQDIRDSQPIISVQMDPLTDQKKEFVQLMNLQTMGEEFYQRFQDKNELSDFSDFQQMGRAFAKFKRDICYCNLDWMQEKTQNESKTMVQTDMEEIDGFVGKVCFGNRIRLEWYVKEGTIYKYDVEDAPVKKFFRDNPIPSVFYYTDQDLEVESEVYITGISTLWKMTATFTRYCLDKYEKIYICKELPKEANKNTICFWNRDINMPVKVSERDTYGRVRLGVYDSILLDNKIFIDFSEISNKKLSHEETEALYKLFKIYYPDAKDFLLADEREQQILIETIRWFLPEGCDVDELVKSIFRKDLRKRQVEHVLGIRSQELIDQEAQNKHYREIERFYPRTTRSYMEEYQESISNDLLNLIFSIAQGFVTVISGKPGSAKGALCDTIGTALRLTNLIMEDGENVSRYQELQVSKTWTDKYVFMDSVLKKDSAYYKAFSLLDYEAKNKNSSTNLPYVFAIKRATAAPVDDYFEDFISICKDWYRKESQMIGHTSLRLSKNTRFLLTVNDQEALFSDDFAATVNVVHIEDPEELCKEIKRVGMRVCGEYYQNVRTIEFKPNPVSIETWTDENMLTDTCRRISVQFMEILSENMDYGDTRIVLEQNRISHAISRYWIVAKNYLQEEAGKSLEEICDTLIPTGVVVDVDCLTNDQEMIPPERVALDYALAQRVLPSVTKRLGTVTLRNASEVFTFLITNQLYRCASELKYAIEVGRVKLSEVLSEEENRQFIINKCKNIYRTAFERAHYDDDERASYILKNICALINQFRDKSAYTKNVILNMLICLTQGFLTVFSGRPGCGKTSICKLLGECLGLTNYNNGSASVIGDIQYPEFRDSQNAMVNPCRFLEVSTERGWTSKRDFIGYYNPLTEQFDKTNAVLYNAFMVMDSERENTDILWSPCFILLDEANLSPMEYYWADFMNLCEAWQPGHSIDLGGGKVFHIPETLHFMATINNDHTTEILSPRLIDRANVIDLPDASYGAIEELSQKLNIRLLPWKYLKAMFGCKESEAVLFREQGVDENVKKMAGLYKSIKVFVEGNFKVSISPRTDIAVSRYWTKARVYFTGENYIVKENLLQQIRENINEELPEQDQLAYIRACLCQAGELERKLNVQSVPEGYITCTVRENTQAMDYAVAQRILPKLTDVSGEKAFGNLVGLLALCVEHELYKSAGIVVDILERGQDTGFYNYFR